LGKILVNSLKIYLEVIFLNVKLVGHACMQENEVPLQVAIMTGLIIFKGGIIIQKLNLNQDTLLITM
jgi:hypothetical protein